MRLIGLHGRAGSGKDTAFGYIERWAEGRDLLAVRRGFADKLKLSAFRALGFQIELNDALVLADDLKSMGEITTVIPQQSVLYTIEGRKFLQLYGTESHRDIFGENFWVDALLPTGHDNPITPRWWESFRDGDALADICVVTDVRFENEAQRIRELGGEIWEIHRGGSNGDQHLSEQPLNVGLIDRTIYNTSSLANLENEVYSALEREART